MDLTKELEAKAKAKGVNLILPVDTVIADDFDKDANKKTVPAGSDFGRLARVGHWT